jgi:hypothetical protein
MNYDVQFHSCQGFVKKQNVSCAGFHRSFSLNGGPIGLEKALRSGGRKAEALTINRAMVVIKTTRYQDEVMLLAGKDTWQEVLQDTMMIRRIDTLLAKEGFDVEALKKSHEAQEAALSRMLAALDKMNVAYTVVKSGESFANTHPHDDAPRDSSLGDSLLHAHMLGLRQPPRVAPRTAAQWDLIISAGGDGTFLKASLQNDGSVPQLGINTDPQRSRGHLCAHTCYQDNAGSLTGVILFH